MQVNLRQAHKLVEKIGARLGTIRLTTSASFSAFAPEDAEVLLRQAREKFDNEVKRQLDLLNARQEIRMSVQSANTAEVNMLVAIRKGLLDELATYRSIQSSVGTVSSTTPEQLKAELDALRNSTQVSYSNVVNTTIMDEARVKELDRKISQLQLRVEGIEEQLSTANTVGIIGVSEQVEQVLRREGIVQ